MLGIDYLTVSLPVRVMKTEPAERQTEKARRQLDLLTVKFDGVRIALRGALDERRRILQRLKDQHEQSDDDDLNYVDLDTREKLYALDVQCDKLESALNCYTTEFDALVVRFRIARDTILKKLEHTLFCAQLRRLAAAPSL